MQFKFKTNLSLRNVQWHQSSQVSMDDSIDSGNSIISVFLDFKKTFDTIHHKILLSKFDFYWIKGVSHEWSYLRERNQITVIDGITFSSSISLGVPQGSVLDPLLFLLLFPCGKGAAPCGMGALWEWEGTSWGCGVLYPRRRPWVWCFVPPLGIS